MTVHYQHLTQLGNRCAEDLPMSLEVAIRLYTCGPREQLGSIGLWSDSTTPRTDAPVRLGFTHWPKEGYETFLRPRAATPFRSR